ncbi:MAG: radical SAM protein [Bacteroidales bacterium]|nr:radical SAM protein [Bacteroidales bacterium]
MNAKYQINEHIIHRIIKNKLFIFNEITSDMFCLSDDVILFWKIMQGEFSEKDILKRSRKDNFFVNKDLIHSFFDFLKSKNIIEPIICNKNYKPTHKEANTQTTELWKFVYEHTKEFFPVTIVWEITYKCNQKCIHCYENCSLNKTINDLDTETIKRILNDLHDSGCFMLYITGGEPFVRKDIFEILSYAKQLNFSIVLLTNASLLSDEEIDFIHKIGIIQVRITLFSLNGEIHDKITNCRGSFEITYSNILKLVEKGISVRLNVPITKYNFNGYRDVIAFAQNNGCEYKISPSLHPKDDGDRSPLSLKISEQEYKEILKNPLANMSDEYANSTEKGENVFCKVVFGELALSPSGQVFPCNSFKYELGNVTKQSVMDIWQNSDVLLKLRSVKIKDSEECGNCKLLSWCFPCPASAWAENHTLYGKSTENCYNARMQHQVMQ